MTSTTCRRTYIFRGKRVSDGKWVYGSLIMADKYCCILEKEEDVHPTDYPYLDGGLGVIDGRSTPVDPDTVSQYIMGKDRNGKMLFEGDIVRIHMRGYGSINELAVIVNQDSLTQNGIGYWRPQDTVHLEAIGNIWDNRELLDERNKKWVDNYYQLMEWDYEE